MILMISIKTCHQLRTVLNKSWKQNSTKQQLYDHLPPILYTIQSELDMLSPAG